eukprot:superscaffoldBa00008244_g23185
MPCYQLMSPFPKLLPWLMLLPAGTTSAATAALAAAVPDPPPAAIVTAGPDGVIQWGNSSVVLDIMDPFSSSDNQVLCSEPPRLPTSSDGAAASGSVLGTVLPSDWAVGHSQSQHRIHRPKTFIPFKDRP